MIAAFNRALRRLSESLTARRTARLTERAKELPSDAAHDLVELSSKGFVRARATGESITHVDAEIENRVHTRLRVVIRPGTYFIARGGHQNMVSRRETTVTLAPRTTSSVSVEASCINAGLPIPEKRHRFRGVKRVPHDLVRFLEASAHADAMVVQAGVWALTDGYTAHDVQTRLVARDRYGNIHQAVSDEDVRQARRILDSLGIRHSL